MNVILSITKCPRCKKDCEDTTLGEKRVVSCSNCNYWQEWRKGE